MLRLASSIAAGTPVNLRDTLTGIDHRNIELVITAVLHAWGGGQSLRFLDHFLVRRRHQGLPVDRRAARARAAAAQLHPGQQVAALRARTRYRKKLIEHRTAENQRLAKVLEDAGIKIDSVASELLGVSGREMTEALIAGERDPRVLAGLARGRLRAKLDDLEMACDGRFTAGHAQMCRLHLDAYDHLTAQIATLDQLVARAAEPFGAVIARLVTIPGIGQRVAEVIVAETGGDMARFASSAKLAAWAGLAPGDNESAGKRKKAPARKGNPHLRAAMVEAAWAVSRTATRPGARFRRLARRLGKLNATRAAVAVAHTLLCIAWAVMKHNGDYAEAGADYYDQRDQRNHEHLVKHHQEALSRLGYQVTLIPPGDGSPPPAQEPAA